MAGSAELQGRVNVKGCRLPWSPTTLECSTLYYPKPSYKNCSRGSPALLLRPWTIWSREASRAAAQGVFRGRPSVHTCAGRPGTPRLRDCHASQQPDMKTAGNDDAARQQQTGDSTSSSNASSHEPEEADCGEAPTDPNENNF